MGFTLFKTQLINRLRDLLSNYKKSLNDGITKGLASAYYMIQ